jgi:hypothetical protein
VHMLSLICWLAWRGGADSFPALQYCACLL